MSSEAAGSERPHGTVTFLFTDIEGSTRLWEERSAQMSPALERHDRILRDAIAASGGLVFSTSGDGLAAAFQRAPDALRAAVAAQSELNAEDWDLPLAVRMAMHTGDVEERGGDYLGPTLNRCSRIMATAHGGQILCSGVTASLAADALPSGSSLRDLGAHRLRDLSGSEHLFQVVHPRLADVRSPLRSLDSYRSNLPRQPTTFVGRELEVIEVAKALEDARLVTLCGVGGVGKTRLALQVAAEVLPRFEDGAWFVELASVGAAEAVVEALASTLGIQHSPSKTLEESVADFVGPASMLLILDNCEHLLNPVAAIVDSSLRAAPGLKVLATSREGLALAGERLFTVGSLETPDDSLGEPELLTTESVRLFTERARESNSGLTFSSDEAHAVGELCVRLDGIPLAIELAAARARVMTPREMIDHLDQRFKLLTSGRRMAVSRHQTLQSTIDWSYDLLDEAERLCLRRLSVFVGDFDAPAAASVVGSDGVDEFDVSDLLFRLVEKSLVLADSASSVTRFRLLETIRDYAWERLVAAGESEGVTRRHCLHFVDFAEERGSGLRGPDEIESREFVTRDLDNLRASLRWAIDAEEPNLALRLVDALSTVAVLRAPFGTLPAEVARLPGADGDPRRAVALSAAAVALGGQGTSKRAADLIDEALELAQAGRGTDAGNRALCRTCSNATMVGSLQADLPRFDAVARSWYEAARALRDPYEISQALNLLAGIALDTNEAVEAGTEALALAHELANPTRIAHASIILGGRLDSLGDDRAEALLTEGLEAAIRARNDWASDFAAMQLGMMHLRGGNFRRAAATFLETAERASDKGDRYTTALALLYVAVVFATNGDDEAALLVGTWSGGYRGGQIELIAPIARGSGEYNILVGQTSKEELAAFAQRAAAMNDREVLALARRRADAMATDEPPGP